MGKNYQNHRVGKKFFYSLSSFSPGLIFYLLTINIFPSLESMSYSFMKCILLLILTYYFSGWLLKDIQKISKTDTIKIVSIQPVEHEIIPTYLGLFVIMLGLGALTFSIQLVILLIIFVMWWLFMERSYYFNVYWLFHFRYYKVEDIVGNTFVIFSKRKDMKLNATDKLVISNLVRINNFTFLEKTL